MHICTHTHTYTHSLTHSKQIGTDFGIQRDSEYRCYYTHETMLGYTYKMIHCTHTHTHTHVRMHACTHSSMNKNMYTHMPTCLNIKYKGTPCKQM